MIYKYNETVSAKALSDLREAVGWNRMKKMVSIICFVDKWKPLAAIKCTYTGKDILYLIL